MQSDRRRRRKNARRRHRGSPHAARPLDQAQPHWRGGCSGHCTGAPLGSIAAHPRSRADRPLRRLGPPARCGDRPAPFDSPALSLREPALRRGHVVDRRDPAPRVAGDDALSHREPPRRRGGAAARAFAGRESNAGGAGPREQRDRALPIGLITARFPRIGAPSWRVTSAVTVPLVAPQYARFAPESAATHARGWCVTARSACPKTQHLFSYFRVLARRSRRVTGLRKGLRHDGIPRSPAPPLASPPALTLPLLDPVALDLIPAALLRQPSSSALSTRRAAHPLRRRSRGYRCEPRAALRAPLPARARGSPGHRPEPSATANPWLLGGSRARGRAASRSVAPWISTMPLGGSREGRR